MCVFHMTYVIRDSDYIYKLSDERLILFREYLANGMLLSHHSFLTKD